MQKCKPYITVAYMLASCMISCHKKTADVKTGPVTYINQRFKDYYDYKAGSFWIYRDSLTGDIDSLVVTNYSDVVIYANYLNHEEIGILIKEYSVGRTPLDSATWVITVENSGAGISFQPTGRQPMGINLGNEQLSLSDTTYYDDYCKTTITMSGHFFQAFHVLNNDFTNVYETARKHEVDSCHHYGRDDQFYINEDAGLVKINLNNSYAVRNWELQRYNINR